MADMVKKKAEQENVYQKEAENFRKECVDAFANEDWDSIEIKINKYKKELELAQNRLNVFQKDDMNQAYYLGQIAALTIVFQQLKNEMDAAAEARLLKKNSPLLEKFIAFIGDNQMVTCGQIVNGLHLKHRSDFSNAMTRQQKYGYIISYKMGNKNLYTLSGKGKKYYLEYLYPEEKELNVGNEITILINTLSNNIRSGEINPVLIAMEMANSSKRLKSYYLSGEFNSALNNYKKAHFISALRIKLKESFRGIPSIKTNINKAILPDDYYDNDWPDSRNKGTEVYDIDFAIK